MKKSLLKSLIALAFSLGALIFMGNVFANSNDEDEGEIGDDPVVVHCSGGPLECARITTGEGEVHLFYKKNEG